ncbi:mfs transporter [Moniliophthora roreri]|nr:mfs transporter [Moniliophthora roreri]
MSSSSTPGLFSLPRIITLGASLLCSLSSGTNYVICSLCSSTGLASPYKPYPSQCRWSGRKRRVLNPLLTKHVLKPRTSVGLYLSGPFWGKIVDSHGPKAPLLSAFVLHLVGYSGIRAIYDRGLPEGTKSLSHLMIFLLVLCSFMTGVGGNAGMCSGINTTARSFPDHVRGSTTGLVISGFGLSAFFFSTLAHIVAPGNTSSFLLLLALGTSLPMLVGLFTVRPIPLPLSEAEHHRRRHDHEHVDYAEVDAASITPSVLNHQDNDSRIHLLGRDEEEEILEESRGVELSPPRSRPSQRGQHQSRSSVGHISVEAGPNVHGLKLFKTGDFWLLSCILSLLSGTGLMYINNVGSMSQALYAHEVQDAFDPVEASKWQSTQVSTISFMNFTGRIVIGLLSDLIKARLGLPRSYLLLLVSTLVLISQLTATHIETVEHLWKASAILGLGYGTVFSLFAALCVEWFGLAHFSENWGYLSLSPSIGGNIFSVAFGRNLDAHERDAATSKSNSANLGPSAPEKEIQCLAGRTCYVDSLKLTTVACLVAIGLSIWAAYRDKKRVEEELEMASASRGGIDVIWEEEEEGR